MDDTLGISLLLATYFNKQKENILILASNLYNAQLIAGLLSSLIGNDNVILFPNDELFRAENLASSKELLSERIYALSAMLNTEKKIVIAHPSSVLRYLPSPVLFQKYTTTITVGEKLNVNNLLEHLVNGGYYRVNKVSRSLEFAKRGDIIDIFSINNDNPIRISLFDDEVESITIFDIVSQESVSKIDKAIITPASDMLFTKGEQSSIKEKILNQLNKDNVDKAKILEDIERIEQFDSSENLYKYYGFLQEQHFSLFDYFKSDLIFFANYKQFMASYDLLIRESQDFLNELVLKNQCITHLAMFHDITRLINNKKIIKGKTYKENNEDIVFNVRPITGEGTSIDAILNTIKSYCDLNNKIIIALSNASQIENVKNILDDAKINYEIVNDLSIPNSKIGLSLFSLNEGFELVDEKIAVITSRELFNYHPHSSQFIARFKEGTALHTYNELKPGDYVVHEYNGIGKFIDIETLEIDGIHRDFMKLLYAHDNKLYVPLNQFKLVRKYSGREGAAPKLSSLDNDAWKKTKQKIKNRINELTDRLSSLYKERANIKGYAFKKDDEYQERFNNEFQHDLTPDQERSYHEIASDMEKPYPMDRLLCGDVGFGKTEVAFRAIFKCINNGKQAAILCPTTLLCRQHYELAKVRFASFDIRIAVFSRLIPLSEQKKYIEEIKNGIIHLVIGTHRLLSKEIEFSDLGLLVVDEEQRFGVEQKERIKEIKTNVDVLSLSATPIPRTLQMSLVGIRELSQITTAPKIRTAIQTYVTPYNDAVIKELIERELSRDGQIFFVHNNVYSIYSTAAKLKRMIPLANIGVVHGQMERDAIEDVMIKFYAGEINLLVATSIIENGLDVPNANMIIVENADMFGLSQLYQIKGRVGRSDRIAYAYLLYNEHKVLNDDARKRLKAIQEFAELGSGYKIAQRDLMIRGAGDILGKEQAGFIDSIGVDLYIKLLNESVSKHNNEEVFATKPNTLFSLDAYIPNDYINKGEKVEVYQEIENVNNLQELKKIKSKLKDIYGRIPSEVNNLIIKKKIDLIIASIEFKSVEELDDKIIVILSESFCKKNGIALKLFDILYEYMKDIKISYISKELRLDINKQGDWINLLENIANKIHNLYLMDK